LRDRVFRGRRTIHHHISSSIWSSVKEEYPVILDNSLWLLGNGKDINFWTDNWCGSSLVDLFNIPTQTSQHLSATVSDFILNGSWQFPPALLQHFNFSHILQNITIPIEESKDNLLWMHTDSGCLQLKDAYLFKSQQFQDLHWAKSIWSPDIPPSKSLMVWRLMHEKVPTDENLLIRGCQFPSMCNFCCKNVESSFHIFFECEFAIKLWSWLANCLNLTLQFSSMDDMWKILDLNWWLLLSLLL
jgi:hypothetical protein